VPHPTRLSPAEILAWAPGARRAMLTASPAEAAKFAAELRHAGQPLTVARVASSAVTISAAPPARRFVPTPQIIREDPMLDANVVREPRGDSRPFIHKRLIGGLGGFVTGGPVGAAAGFLTSGGGGVTLPAPVQNPFTGGCATGFRRNAAGQCVADVALPGIIAAGQRLLPGGATGTTIALQPGMACPSGFHPNKSNYWTVAGFVAEGSRCVRNRRRNNLNQSAIRRSVGRIGGFVREVKKVDKMLKKIAPPAPPFATLSPGDLPRLLGVERNMDGTQGTWGSSTPRSRWCVPRASTRRVGRCNTSWSTQD